MAEKKQRPTIRALTGEAPPPPKQPKAASKANLKPNSSAAAATAGAADDDDERTVPGVIPLNVLPLQSDKPSGLVPRYQKALDSLLEARGEQRTAKLSFKELGDEGAAKLAIMLGTGTCKNLVGLDISCNSIGINGAKALANSLSANTTLQSVDLSANGIGDNGATALASALAFNNTLQHLDLHACNISDTGAKALAGVLLDGNISLLVLNLKANYIGDDGALKLAEVVRKSKTLRGLITGSNDITKKGQIALDKAFYDNENVSTSMPTGEHDNIVGEMCSIS